jgi:chromosome segregation ATPase
MIDPTDTGRPGRPAVPLPPESNGGIEQLERENARLRDALLAAERDLADATQLRVEFDELRSLAEAMQDDLQAALRDLQATVTERDDQLERYQQVVNSSSWTATAPFRRAMAVVHRRHR